VVFSCYIAILSLSLSLSLSRASLLSFTASVL
jgi:hypothetical protein